MIIPTERDITFVNDLGYWQSADEQHWYPLDPPITEQSQARVPDGDLLSMTEQAHETLRSLSCTCKALRAVVLPILWSVCHIHTVHELGEIRDALRASPHLARCVRAFSFLWCAPDADKLYWYAEDRGTLLELAFASDRWQLWHDVAEEHGCEIEESSRGRYFVLDGKDFDEPGRPPMDVAASSGLPAHGRLGTRGPDGWGEDTRIKTPQQFNESIVEVVSQLTSLQSFAWDAAGIPVPQGAFDALRKLDELKSLRLNMSVHRCSVQMRESSSCSSVCKACFADQHALLSYL